MRTLYLSCIKHPILNPINLNILISFYFGTKAFAHNPQTDSSNNSILIQEWLTKGPVEKNIPVVYGHKNSDGQTFKVLGLLRPVLKKVTQPIEGIKFLKNVDKKYMPNLTND